MIRVVINNEFSFVGTFVFYVSILGFIWQVLEFLILNEIKASLEDTIIGGIVAWYITCLERKIYNG